MSTGGYRDAGMPDPERGEQPLDPELGEPAEVVPLRKPGSPGAGNPGSVRGGPLSSLHQAIDDLVTEVSTSAPENHPEIQAALRGVFGVDYAANVVHKLTAQIQNIKRVTSPHRPT